MLEEEEDIIAGVSDNFKAHAIVDEKPQKHEDGPEEMFTLGKSKLNSTKGGIDVVVGLMDDSEVSVFCEQGRYVTAGELRDKVAEELGLDDNHKNLFAIWVVSELQLKLYHTPIKVIKKWSEMVLAYSNEDPYSEIPALIFKRDAMVHQGLERKVKDTLTKRLFFHEMAFNVIHSIYPCSLIEAEVLAAIQLHAALGPTATKADVLDVPGCVIPHHLKANISSKKWVKEVLAEREQIVIPHQNVDALYDLYLQVRSQLHAGDVVGKHGWEWSYYGAVFFQAEIESKETTIWREVASERIRVGVNLEGIHVVSESSNAVKLSLAYDKLKYNSWEDPEDGKACFLVEFSPADAPMCAPKASKKTPLPEKHSLVLWTRQAGMIDALATRYLAELDKWQDYLAEKARSRGEIPQAVKNVQNRRAVQRGTGLTATLSKFIGRGGAAPDQRAGFTLSKFRFQTTKKMQHQEEHAIPIASRTTVDVDESLPSPTARKPSLLEVAL